MLPNSLRRLKKKVTEIQRSPMSGLHSISLILFCLHWLLLTYTHMPPPLLFPEESVLLARTKEKPSNSIIEFGMSWRSQDSVNTMMDESLYSKQCLLFVRSSSILLRSDLML